MGSIFHEMSEEELNKQLKESRAELREMRFTFAEARSLPDPANVRKTKRNIARILTVLKERSMGLTTQKEKTDRSGKKGGKSAKSAAKK